MLVMHEAAIKKAKQWINDNTVDGGIIHSSSLRKPYPEVTGYYIPSLLKWQEIDLAKSYGDWLISIQTDEGGWQDTSLQTIYTFDTGQILKGLFELIPYGEKYEKSFLKGCDWLLTQITPQGKIQTPTTEHFSGIGSEYIHLYAIEPLKLAGEKYNRQDYLDAVSRAVKYYISQEDLTDFKFLSHFHAYVVEALIDLGEHDRAKIALDDLEKNYQKPSGAIPAYHNVRWVCLTALFQYAVCYYKLGELEKGNRLFDFALSKQNESGGFFGGSGWFVTYFKKTEISWPIKYFLDALYLRKQLEIAGQSQTDLNEDSYVQAYVESHRDSITRDYKINYLPEIMMDGLSISKNHSVLYVGCGTGGFIKAFKQTSNFVGLDCSEKMIKAAHNLSNLRGDGKSKWIVSTFEYFDSQDKFDVIHLGVYGPLVPLTSDVLVKSKYMLKNDGLVFCPVVNYNMSRMGKIKHAIRHILKYRNFSFDNIAVSKMMFKDAGFDIVATISVANSYCSTYLLKKNA